jgi:hypothetical protein
MQREARFFQHNQHAQDNQRMQQANEDLQKDSIKAKKQPKSQTPAYQRAAVQQRFSVIGGVVAGR